MRQIETNESLKVNAISGTLYFFDLICKLINVTTFWASQFTDTITTKHINS